jgi:hypothetical protein
MMADEKRKPYRSLKGMPEGNKLLGRLRFRWGYNMGWCGLDCSGLG